MNGKLIIKTSGCLFLYLTWRQMTHFSHQLKHLDFCFARDLWRIKY